MKLRTEQQPVRWTTTFPHVTGGGDEGTRTLNPRLAKAVLYQLSYVPGSQARRVPSGDSDAWCGGLTP